MLKYIPGAEALKAYAAALVAGGTAVAYEGGVGDVESAWKALAAAAVAFVVAWYAKNKKA